MCGDGAVVRYLGWGEEVADDDEAVALEGFEVHFCFGGRGKFCVCWHVDICVMFIC